MFWPFTRNSNAEGSVGTIIEQGPFLPDRVAFKLFGELGSASGTSNVFYSPFSVLLCLMMVWEGARGETREAMTRVLEISEDPESCQRFLKSTLTANRAGVERSVANSPSQEDIICGTIARFPT